MSNPTFKLADSTTTIYRDNADNNKTVFKNNNIDILKLSGTGGQDTIDVTGNVNISTNYDISGTNVLDSTTLGTGIVNSSLTSVGVLDELTVTGEVIINGDLTITGTTTTINTETLTIEDPLIKLGNQNTGDIIDIGFYGLYNDGTTKYSGLFRDATNNTFNFFTGTTIEPTTNIDTNSDNGYLKGDLVIGDMNALTSTIIGDFTVDINTLHVDSIFNNVGIGKTDPIYKLDVVGDINTTTDYNILGTQVLSDTTLGNGIVNSSLTSIGTLNHNINTTATDYQINGTSVLNATTLGSAIINSSLTSNTGNLTNTGIFNLTSGNDFRIDSTSVLNATTLGSGVVNSSLTSIGTLNHTINTTGTDYQINGTSVLNATTLGSAVVNSSLTSVGTLTSATISGDLYVNLDTFCVDSTFNNVGIGIIAPSSKLHVEDDTDNQAGETSNHGFKITTGASGQSLMIGYDGDDDMSYINSGKTGANTNLTLQTRGGNVGVGITNPSYELDIYGDLNFTGTMFQDGVTLTIGGQWAPSGTDVYNINSGNVGIGTETPSYELDVNGDINLSGVFYQNGTTFVGSLWNESAGDLSYSAGNIGIGIANPNAKLQFDNAIANRKIVMWESTNNDHQYYGFGINGSILRYQTDDPSADHVFYSGINSSSSLELMRIKGDGDVEITGNLLNNSKVFFSDEKAAGYGGGNATAGNQYRDINTIVNSQSWFTLNGTDDGFTLDAGTYEIYVVAPAHKTNQHQIKLHNYTDSTNDLQGTTEYSGSSDYTATTSTMMGIFTLSASKEMRIQHWIKSARNSDGLGAGIYTGSGVNNVFTTGWIKKIG